MRNVGQKLVLELELLLLRNLEGVEQGLQRLTTNGLRNGRDFGPNEFCRKSIPKFVSLWFNVC